jgi:hypothetical protein
VIPAAYAPPVLAKTSAASDTAIDGVSLKWNLPCIVNPLSLNCVDRGNGKLGLAGPYAC